MGAATGAKDPDDASTMGAKGDEGLLMDRDMAVSGVVAVVVVVVVAAATLLARFFLPRRPRLKNDDDDEGDGVLGCFTTAAASLLFS